MSGWARVLLGRQTARVLALLLAAISLYGFCGVLPSSPPAWASGGILIGRVYDTQGRPVEGARVQLQSGPRNVVSVRTQPDGVFALLVPSNPDDHLHLRVQRTHYRPLDLPLPPEARQALKQGQAVVLPDIRLSRSWGPAFWATLLVFLLMLVLIGSGRLHNTMAALVGTSLLFAISSLGSLVTPALFIFDFQRAVGFVDWNVIFLIMGMMIFIAIVERTGVFQWLAFAAYRLSRGHTWLLLPILMGVTGIASAFLDNVTTMLLMAPISVEIALALSMNPLALLIPEVMASNVVGVSTLIGTPTNILIASYAGISFDDFLSNLTPGVLLAFVGLIIYSEVIYWRDLKAATLLSPELVAKLEEHAHITDPVALRKAAWVGAGMLVLFSLGEHIHLLPAVTALMGATVLLLWVKLDIEEMIEAVDWTTLVFFMSLFIVIGAVREVGIIDFIADLIGSLVGTNLLLAMLVIMWSGAALSAVVDNIPFTAAMLPVVGTLTGHIPGAESKALYYCLSVGSAMGGNGTLIGSSPNLVTAGIAERAGYPITYTDFLKKGVPAVLVTVFLAGLWLLIHFLLLGG